MPGSALTATGEGPPVVLVHGLGLDRRMWRRQVPALVGAGYRAVACDLLGHGRADRPTRPGSAYSVDDLAEDLLAALDRAKTADRDGRLALIGLSLGGVVAQAIALAAPTRVAALVLADTAAWMGPEASAVFTERAAVVESEGVEVLVAPAIERWFTPELVATRPDEVTGYAKILRENDPFGYAAACRSLATFDVRARLLEICCPTLVVVGDRDRATPPEMARLLADGIPGAELRVLGPAGHLPTEECWPAFNEAVLGFLARAYPTRAGHPPSGALSS